MVQYIEIIAVNDCSKGNMQEILDNLKIKDSRLKVITNPVNKGLFHSRIIGSKEATGDYISFVDSDDYVDKDFYRLLVNNMEENDSDIGISNFVRKNKKEEYISSLNFNSNNAVYEGKEFYNMFFEQTGRNIRYHILCSKLIKADIWKKVLEKVSKIPGYGINKNHQTYNDNTLVENNNTFVNYVYHIFVERNWI